MASDDTSKTDAEAKALNQTAASTDGDAKVTRATRTPKVAKAEAAKPAEAVVEPEPTPIKAPLADPVLVAEVPVTPPPSRGGFGALLGTVLGGALCFAAGYGVATYAPNYLPQLEPAGLADLRGTIATQQSEIAALKSAPAPDAGMAARLAQLEADQQASADLDQRFAALEARVAALPAAGASDLPTDVLDQIAALRAQVQSVQSVAGDGGQQAVQAAVRAAEQAVQQQTQAAEARVGELTASAEAAARKTLADAAMARLAAALDTGLPYGTALTDLGAEVPAVLADAAGRGLPTLTTLRDAFPQAARQGLEAALVANMGNSWTERAANFLRAQTGARSLSPREGTDPDAILSRAEAALTRGDATAALTEVQALPEPAQQAMSGWIALAQQRIEAEQAISTLASQIGAE